MQSLFRYTAPVGTCGYLPAERWRLERRIGESEFELGQDDWLEVLDTLVLPQ